MVKVGLPRNCEGAFSACSTIRWFLPPNAPPPHLQAQLVVLGLQRQQALTFLIEECMGIAQRLCMHIAGRVG